MRLAISGGRRAVLGYCANVHPGESLADVLEMTRRWAGPVRRELGVDELAIGLWISRGALDGVRRAGSTELREALAAERLFCCTLNGFPYGNFQAGVVKRAVYHPDLGTPQRERYLLELAELLAELLPADVEEGTISTLPLGHRGEAAPELLGQALSRLCAIAGELALLRDRTGRAIRICLEPEPGCLLERTADAVEFFAERLPRAARQEGASLDAIRNHLGVCFDTCHQAVAFEDAHAALTALGDAGIVVGKMQLSSALRVPDPERHGRALAAFDEPRFLHQVRARADDGSLLEADDLPESVGLPRDREWRVHFHVPIQAEVVGALATTRAFLEQSLESALGAARLPHFEVETYTWSVLPEAERPRDDAGLVRGLAAELQFARSRLS
jgi:sugar phosphate isomerase/epimerase